MSALRKRALLELSWLARTVNIRGHEANFCETEARCHEAEIEAEARKSEAEAEAEAE